MNLVLLGRTLAAQRVKLLVVMVALGFWGLLMPIVYATFGADFRRLLESGAFPIPREFTQFGGGDITTLPGSIALGFIHPMSVALICVFAVGFAAAAVAGERQRGTLEVLLSRPVSRRALVVTLFVATLIFVGLAVLAVITGSLIGATLFDVIDELELANVPALWLNGTLLFMAFASIGLAASVSFDRLTPALGITLGVTILSYFLDVIGTIWRDVDWLRPYSLFYYLNAPRTLVEGFEGFDLGLLALVVVAGLVFALVAFPRRDIAAPS
jgi:ABC-2 type transport system permease protein